MSDETPQTKNVGSGAVANQGSVASGEHGAAIQGGVQGDVTVDNRQITQDSPMGQTAIIGLVIIALSVLVIGAISVFFAVMFKTAPTLVATLPPIAASESVVTHMTVALQTYDGRYVTAMNDEGGRDWVLRSQTHTIGDWEKFSMLCLVDGKMALQTYHGRYVTALDDEAGRDWKLKAETRTIGDWEKFVIIRASTGELLPCQEASTLVGSEPISVALRTYYDRYITAMNDQNDRDWILRAQTQMVSDWERFTIVAP